MTHRAWPGRRFLGLRPPRKMNRTSVTLTPSLPVPYDYSHTSHSGARAGTADFHDHEELVLLYACVAVGMTAPVTGVRLIHCGTTKT